MKGFIPSTVIPVTSSFSVCPFFFSLFFVVPSPHCMMVGLIFSFDEYLVVVAMLGLKSLSAEQAKM